MPSSGKTTVFNALTGSDLPVGEHAVLGQVNTHTAIVSIEDKRLQSLSELYQPRKTTPAQIVFGELTGLSDDGTLSGELVNQLAQWEAMFLILRGFEHPLTGEPGDPQGDLETIEAEFLLSDLLRVEARLERLQEDRQKGARNKDEIEREQKLFSRLNEHLQHQEPLRDLGLADAELDLLLGFGLLTLKPILAVQNLEESGSAVPLNARIPASMVHGQLESELAQLSSEEAQTFRSEFGIGSSGIERLIRAAAELLQKITFFTVSEAEVKAWQLRDGASVLEAAGTVHSDMARGFIRAEVVSWDQLLELGGLPEARAAGKLRVEGKEYVPQDGEVIHIRFNV